MRKILVIVLLALSVISAACASGPQYVIAVTPTPQPSPTLNYEERVAADVAATVAAMEVQSGPTPPVGTESVSSGWPAFRDALAALWGDTPEATSVVVQGTPVPTSTPVPSSTPVVESSVALSGSSTEWQFNYVGREGQIPMTEVDYAKGGFSSPWSFLSLALAEPGKLVVGAEFPQSQIDGARGAIWRSDGLNTYRLNQPESQNIGCAEGAFVFISAQEARVQTTNFDISFRAPDGDGVHLYVRCQNSDDTRGSDAGNNLLVSGFRQNYGSVIHFSGQPAGGFVSAGGARQALDIGTSATSSGSEGANNVWVIAIDSNTGAYSVGRWDGETMHFVESNWWSAQ